MFQGLIEEFNVALPFIMCRDMSLENVLVDVDKCMIIDMGMCLRVPYNDPKHPGKITDVTRGSTRRLMKPQGVCGKHNATLALTRLLYIQPSATTHRQAQLHEPRGCCKQRTIWWICNRFMGSWCYPIYYAYGKVLSCACDYAWTADAECWFIGVALASGFIGWSV